MHRLHPFFVFIGSLCIGLIFCVGIFYIGYTPSSWRLDTLSKPLFLYPLLIIAFELLIRGIRLQILNAIWDRPLTLSKSLIINLAGDFANAVTPASIGGAPLRGWHLMQNGLPLTKATAVIIGERLTDHLALITLIILLILTSDYKAYGLEFYLPLMAIFSIAGCLFVYFLLKENKTGASHGKLKLWSPSSWLDYWSDNHRLQQIKEQMITVWAELKVNFYFMITRGKWRFVLAWVLAFLSQCMRFLLIVSLAVGLHIEIPVSVCVLWSVCKRYGLDVIPIPGASGVTEAAFIWFFGRYTTLNTLGIFMLIWRVYSYYIYILVGGVLLFFTYRDYTSAFSGVRHHFNNWRKD